MCQNRTIKYFIKSYLKTLIIKRRESSISNIEIWYKVSKYFNFFNPSMHNVEKWSNVL